MEKKEWNVLFSGDAKMCQDHVWFWSPNLHLLGNWGWYWCPNLDLLGNWGWYWSPKLYLFGNWGWCLH